MNTLIQDLLAALPTRQVITDDLRRLAYGTDEAVEGCDSFLEKRDPDWSPFPYYY